MRSKVTLTFTYEGHRAQTYATMLRNVLKATNKWWEGETITGVRIDRKTECPTCKHWQPGTRETCMVCDGVLA